MTSYGKAVLLRICAELPQVQVIGLSMYESAEQGQPMLEAGAGAYLSKSAPAEELLAAIRACHSGMCDPLPPDSTA